MSSNRQQREHTTTIIAKGNGSCALNSLAIGLVLQHLDYIFSQSEHFNEQDENDFQTFILSTGKLLNIKNPTTQNVKNKLMALRDSNDIDSIQAKLAISLRQLAIRLLTREPYKSKHRNETFHSLSVAYKHFTDHEKNEDDIYSKYSVIQNAFKSSKNIEALEEWWNKEGYHIFLNLLAREGEWLGDAELAIIAKFFTLNLDIYKANDQIIHAHEEQGYLPCNAFNTRNDAKLMDVLIARTVIRHSDDGKAFPIITLSDKELNERLAPINNAFIAYIETKSPQKDEPMPNQLLALLSDQEKQQLKLRGAINYRQNTFVFAKDYSDKEKKAWAHTVVTDLSRLRNIINIYRKPAPTVIVEHTSSHYNSIITTQAKPSSEIKRMKLPDISKTSNKYAHKPINSSQEKSSPIDNCQKTKPPVRDLPLEKPIDATKSKIPAQNQSDMVKIKNILTKIKPADKSKLTEFTTSAKTTATVNYSFVDDFWGSFFENNKTPTSFKEADKAHLISTKKQIQLDKAYAKHLQKLFDTENHEQTNQIKQDKRLAKKLSTI